MIYDNLKPRFDQVDSTAILSPPPTPSHQTGSFLDKFTHTSPHRFSVEGIKSNKDTPDSSPIVSGHHHHQHHHHHHHHLHHHHLQNGHTGNSLNLETKFNIPRFIQTDPSITADPSNTNNSNTDCNNNNSSSHSSINPSMPIAIRLTAQHNSASLSMSIHPADKSSFDLHLPSPLSSPEVSNLSLNPSSCSTSPSNSSSHSSLLSPLSSSSSSSSLLSANLCSIPIFGAHPSPSHAASPPFANKPYFKRESTADYDACGSLSGHNALDEEKCLFNYYSNDYIGGTNVYDSACEPAEKDYIGGVDNMICADYMNFQQHQQTPVNRCSPNNRMDFRNESTVNAGNVHLRSMTHIDYNNNNNSNNDHFCSSNDYTSMAGTHFGSSTSDAKLPGFSTFVCRPQVEMSSILFDAPFGDGDNSDDYDLTPLENVASSDEVMSEQQSLGMSLATESLFFGSHGILFDFPDCAPPSPCSPFDDSDQSESKSSYSFNPSHNSNIQRYNVPDSRPNHNVVYKQEIDDQQTYSQNDPLVRPQHSPNSDEGFEEPAAFEEQLPNFVKLDKEAEASSPMSIESKKRPRKRQVVTKQKKRAAETIVAVVRERRKPGRKPGQVSNVLHLWEFMRDLLYDPETSGAIIEWISKSEGVFKVVNSAEVARLWGQKKNNKKEMTYEKLSRSLRYSREEGYFDSLPKDKNYPKKLCFKFGPKSTGWSRCKYS